MHKFLITWELGGGLGHVGPLRAIGAELENRGFEVATDPYVIFCEPVYRCSYSR